MLNKNSRSFLPFLNILSITLTLQRTNVNSILILNKVNLAIHISSIFRE